RYESGDDWWRGNASHSRRLDRVLHPYAARHARRSDSCLALRVTVQSSSWPFGRPLLRRLADHLTPMTGLSAGALKSSQLLLTSSLVTAAENTGLCIRR